MKNDNRQTDKLWEAYQASFRKFAKQASALDLSEEGTLQMLALEEARAAYSQARDAVAMSLLDLRAGSEDQSCQACACV
jgi:hypothetical protein